MLRVVVETRKPFEKPLSLLDLDLDDVGVKDVPLLDLDGTGITSEPTESDPMTNELKDLIHFDDEFLSSYNGQTTSQKGTEDDGKICEGNKRVDSMVQANLSAFTMGTVGLTARKRVN